MQIKLNFNALITETKDKLTTPSVANRVDAFVIILYISHSQQLTAVTNR